MWHFRNSVWQHILFLRAQELQRFFSGLAASEETAYVGNARYIRQQAGDYAHTMELGYAEKLRVREPGDAGPKVYRVHARTELSRILALALRECEQWGWDFFEVISEGVEYELDVRKAIEAGTRDIVPTYERR